MQPLNQWTDSITDNEQKAYKKEHQSEYLYRLQEIKRTGATTVNLLALVEAGLVDASLSAYQRIELGRLKRELMALQKREGRHTDNMAIWAKIDRKEMRKERLKLLENALQSDHLTEEQWRALEKVYIELGGDPLKLIEHVETNL